MNKVKKLFGIDTLYLFFETNENYDDLYLEILDQLEEIKGKFQKKEIDYENKDLYVSIKDTRLNFLGKKEGFYWFKDLNEFFRIGFKSMYENRGLNDIRVQLQGNGIYAIGINSLIELLKDLVKEYITDYIPITRADLNCFIQYDLSFIKKDMFSTRKRKYSTINEIGDANSTQTIYIGKEPFKLRLYNKSLELKKSKKYDLMNEYFLNNDFDIEESIFNIEFQMHRTHLRQYQIETLDDLLTNAKNLFQISMDEIRLIDIDSVSKERLKNNKYQADTHPLWKEIKQEYNLKDFLQSSLPLERLKRKVSIYDDNKFEFEFIALVRKALISNLNLDDDYINELYKKAKDSLNKTTSTKELKKRYTDVEIINKDGQIENLRLLEDGNLIKPLRTETVSKLQDYDLLVYLDKTREKKHLSSRDKHIYYVALKEATKRNLVLDISADEAQGF
ncbi:hypothetical protein [Arcobacter roscoffensis]|uniref:Replication initiation protein n=1 Tax=Arcobacter roscoffensis TaxID=2961520 RepID=A0ABY5E4J9_9BACT|nr:hypothetical protein [Arcobacter roscoffensis]UTJ06645.1 hypothetical protein NJU99_00720 [Arcobacter roscoffensis]